MALPHGLSATLAAVALAVAAYAAIRLAAAQTWRRRLYLDINLSHVLMGNAMAGMFLPSLNVLPARAWEGVFAAEAAWLALAAARFVRGDGMPRKDHDKAHRASHYATHAVMALSMLYVFLDRGALPTGHASMAMPATLAATGSRLGGATWVSLLFVVVLLVSATCEIDSAHRSARSGALSTATGRFDAASHVAMCIAMAYMLVVMW